MNKKVSTVYVKQSMEGIMTSYHEPVISVKLDKYYLRILSGDKVSAGIWFRTKQDMFDFKDALTKAIALAPEIEDTGSKKV